MATTPVEYPSTWQLLFGKNHRHDDNQHHESRTTNSHSVADQLLSALNKPSERPEDALGQELSVQLLGKRNAFVPELRAVDGETTSTRDRTVCDQARDILHSRLTVDRRADELKKPRQQPHHKAVKAKTTAAVTTAERLAKLHEIQHKREEAVRLQREEEQRRKRQQEVLQRATRKPKATTATSTRARALRVATRPAKPVAVSKERRPPSNQDEELHSAPHANTTSHQAPATAKQQVRAKRHDDPSHHEQRELRVIDEKLRRLQEETKMATAAERDRTLAHHVLQIKRRVWALWCHRVDRHRQHEASVTRTFEWRQLQKFWSAWRHVARAATSHRAAEAARTALVLAKQQSALADRHFRRRHLPVWFHRWRASARSNRDNRALEEEMRRRREHAQRLVEKLARDKATGAGDTVAQSPPPEQDPKPATRTRHKSLRTQASPPTAPGEALKARSTPSQPLPLPLPSTAANEKPQGGTSAPPPPDAFYLSMQERATQRKARRDELQAKYAAQEQEKREALARQLAEREALLEQQKREEKEARRARQRAAAEAARQLAVQREAAAIQRDAAALHDRLRLLIHYGWQPWRQQWVLRKRIERQADKWRRLRLQHRVWLAWLEIVAARRRQREQAERERLAWAAQHHNDWLLRRVLTGWRFAGAATRQKELALRRHTQWNALRGAWRQWRRELVVEVDRQQREQDRARKVMDRTRIKRVLQAWRAAAAESASERRRREEKDRLWQKAKRWLNE